MRQALQTQGTKEITAKICAVDFLQNFFIPKSRIPKLEKLILAGDHDVGLDPGVLTQPRAQQDPPLPIRLHILGSAEERTPERSRSRIGQRQRADLVRQALPLVTWKDQQALVRRVASHNQPSRQRSAELGRNGQARLAVKAVSVLAEKHHCAVVRVSSLPMLITPTVQGALPANFPVCLLRNG